MSCSWLYVLVVALCLCGVSASVNDDIREKIYTTYTDPLFCTRLLRTTGTVGCQSPRDAEGALRNTPTQTALDALIASSPSDASAVIMPQELFTAANVQKLKDGIKMAGIIVINDGIIPSNGWSPAQSSPQSEMALTDAQRNYVWNSRGDSLTYMDLNFAIILVTQAQGAEILQRVGRDSDFSFAAEFNYNMLSSGTSLTCLPAGTCLPIGGFSAWATPIKQYNDTKPIVMGVASIDASAFFREAAYGANAPISGAIALMAAFEAVVGVHSHLDALPRRISFNFFDAESWAYAGSRRFLAEIGDRFKCLTPNPNDGTCAEPNRDDLAFLNISLDRIHSVLELGQLALNDTVYMHREHDSNTNTDALISTLSAQTGSVPTVAAASTSTPGVPPSSYTSFLSARPSIGGVVLTDFDAEYNNKYYGSRFDDNANLPATTGDRLCKVATLTARALFRMAGGNASVGDSIQASCTRIDALLQCWTQNFNCPLAVELFGTSALRSSVNHYSSVYIIQNYEDIGGFPAFLHRFLAKAISEAGASGGAHYHDAVDPSIEFDLASRRWQIVNSTASPIWAEANWGGDTRVRFYAKESKDAEIAMLSLGLVLTAVSVAVVHFLSKYCDQKFKVV